MARVERNQRESRASNNGRPQMNGSATLKGEPADGVLTGTAKARKGANNKDNKERTRNYTCIERVSRGLYCCCWPGLQRRTGSTTAESRQDKTKTRAQTKSASLTGSSVGSSLYFDAAGGGGGPRSVWTMVVMAGPRWSWRARLSNNNGQCAEVPCLMVP